MEEKKAENSNSIRSIFSLRFFNKLFSKFSNNLHSFKTALGNRGFTQAPLFNGNAVRDFKKRVGMNLLRSGAGFTLIELIVVIAIIGTLATVLIVLINPKAQIQRANDVKRKAEIKQIQAALELYRADNGSYPAANGDYQSDISDSSCSGNGGIINGSTVYLSKIPCDPLKTDEYYYAITGGGSGYILVACLENAGDPDITTPNCSSGNRDNHPYRFQVTNP